MGPRASDIELTGRTNRSVNVEPELRGSGKIIVARAGSTTIAVLIKAADETAYDEWLPIAQPYIDSFEFEAAEESSAASPFLTSASACTMTPEEIRFDRSDRRHHRRLPRVRGAAA